MDPVTSPASNTPKISGDRAKCLRRKPSIGIDFDGKGDGSSSKPDLGTSKQGREPLFNCQIIEPFSVESAP
jgi:hypothetical protein